MNNKLDEHFIAGYKAFSQVDERENKRFGVRFHQMANPLKPNGKYTHTAHREWQRGWNTAYFKNLEKQNGLRKRS
tara:strand:+ start:705 stop:929 length:225 start_codon:yes stop_codon:yes gene_type:complete